jgi:hypothetical protein
VFAYSRLPVTAFFALPLLAVARGTRQTAAVKGG